MQDDADPDKTALSDQSYFKKNLKGVSVLWFDH